MCLADVYTWAVMGYCHAELDTTQGPKDGKGYKIEQRYTKGQSYKNERGYKIKHDYEVEDDYEQANYIETEE